MTNENLSIGERIRIELKRRKRPITSLARELDVTQASMSRWLSDDKLLRAPEVRRIAGAIGVTVGYLYGESPIVEDATAA
jgi:transcriptional regulator with XRE-family HTH domain